jgi:hypothetical protein
MFCSGRTCSAATKHAISMRFFRQNNLKIRMNIAHTPLNPLPTYFAAFRFTRLSPRVKNMRYALQPFRNA